MDWEKEAADWLRAHVQIREMDEPFYEVERRKTKIVSLPECSYKIFENGNDDGFLEHETKGYYTCDCGSCNSCLMCDY